MIRSTFNIALLVLTVVAISVTPVFTDNYYYEGSVGNSEVILKIDTDGKDGFYLYKKWDTPIHLRGWLANDTLYMQEGSLSVKESALLALPFNDMDNDTLYGQWISGNKKILLPATFVKTIELTLGDHHSYEKLEIPVEPNTAKHYFHLIVSKSENLDIEISEIRVFEKVSDKHIQTLKCASPFYDHGFSVDDFNEDGFLDISILLWYNNNGTICDAERFLWNPKTGMYDDGYEERFNGQE